MIDNTSAVAYINYLGGTVSPDLVSLAKDLWMWCLERNIPTPPWAVQSSGRCGVTHNEGLDRLEPETSSVPEDRLTIRPNRVDLFASRTVPSFQLAARSLCSHDRCIPSGLVTQKGVCESPMVSNRQSPSTDSDPTGYGDTS